MINRRVTENIKTLHIRHTGNFKNKGITLIALVITIIILLILTGITIVSLRGSGLFEKSKLATEEYNKSQIKEELQLAVNTIQIQLMKENEEISIENIVEKLKENDGNYLNENIEKLDSDGTNGKYQGYNFYIDLKTFEVILGNKVNQINSSKYMIFNGNTYFDTLLKDEQLIENEEFTISTSIYINRDMQSRISNMGILGNHSMANGMAWQFDRTTNNLVFVIRNSGILSIDYTPYYEKWTDIVMTYNKGNIKIYFDNELKATVENLELIPYGNIYIGTAFLEENRTMSGAIKPIRVWKKELPEEDINKINYNDKNTNIQTDFIIKEISFNEDDLKTINGINYDLVPIEKQIDYNVKLCGGNYLDINLPESTILENSEFTIAARVKINRNEQQSIPSMGILGNHDSNSGIAWQFNSTTKNLEFVYGNWDQGKYISIDYTPYYDKFIDIIVTYKEKILSIYINNEKIDMRENVDIVPKGNLCIGSSLNNTSRGINGYLPYVKIWNKELTETQVENLKMDTNTNIERHNILRELDLVDIEEFSNYGTLVTNSYKITMIGK